MSHPNFNQVTAMAAHGSGLASRRGGGQNIKPLSFDSLKSPNMENTENGAPTPRTSRSHLLAGLRTAPKSATAATFPNNSSSPTTSTASHMRNRNSMTPGAFDNVNLYSGPKTSLPQYSTSQQGYKQQAGFGQQYTVDQILAPPQIQLDEQIQDHIDPSMQAQLLMANAYLADQQHRLQQQLRNLQIAAQQFQGINSTTQSQIAQQQYVHLYQQQQQQQQQVQAMQAMIGNQPVYRMYDPTTGQQTYFVDQSQAQLNAINQAQLATYQNLQQQQQQSSGTPIVQVSPPTEYSRPNVRTSSPPRRHEPAVENVTPLPPPSANAFRRGHKKTASLANNNKGLSIATVEEPLTSAGPKTAHFPLTPLTASGYGPGQARAGEHPVRQPRNPPSLDELKDRPTAKHEGSKNFVTRTRRSAVHNLVRAGLERRKEARSTGSVSPISESTEEMVETPLTDNDSDSGRSGSGSLVDNDDVECSLPSSRTSTGSWGAIGSDRPSSRQKTSRCITESPNTSDNEVTGSFASLLKGGAGLKSEVAGQRKAPMLVLTNARERRSA